MIQIQKQQQYKLYISTVVVSVSGSSLYLYISTVVVSLSRSSLYLYISTIVVSVSGSDDPDTETTTVEI
jgi:hypothetical protein